MYHTGEDIIDNIFQPNTKENCHSFSCSHLLRQPLAATCSHLPKQPLEATCSHLQPLAASHLQPLAQAATCSHRLKQPLAATCSYWQPLAATCQSSHLKPLAATCSHLQPATCSHLQPLAQAATCSHRLKQPLAATGSHLLPLAQAATCPSSHLLMQPLGSHLAATWQPLPDTCPKWLQQVAAKWLLEHVAAKWLQVAASGCFFEIAHLLRPQWSVRFRGFAWTIPLEAPKSFSFQTKFSWPFNPMSTSKANSSGDKVLS